MKLLLVEDEAILMKAVAKGLRKTGYAVDCAADGEEALDLYECNDYDLMILDLNLPKVDGMEVLRRIRQWDQELKILILSARDSIEDKIEGLDSGSNDYLTKPFEFLELEARIRSLLRRRFKQEDVLLRCGDLMVNTAQKSVYCREKKVSLTKKEYGILEYLLTYRGQILRAEDVIEHVWDSDADLFSNAFKFQIHSLKKKLEQAGLPEGYITNLRGQGYKIEQPEDCER